jgi:sugar lactone lactonase YvrE
MTKTLSAPNGIAFSPDQKTLYVSDTASNKVVSFPVTVNGTVGRPAETTVRRGLRRDRSR